MLDRAQRLIGDLPGVTREKYYDTEALKAGGKALANPCREPRALAVHCWVGDKELLIAAAPDLYFETDHFRGWPAVLVRMDRIDDATLKARLTAAWEMRAPKKLVKAFRAGAPKPPEAET